MSRLIYPGSRKIKGPWLLDKNNLQKFETMIGEVVAELCADSGKEYKPEYTITFSSGKSIVEHSLQDFDIINDIRAELPQELVVKIYYGNISILCTELTFNLNERMLQSFSYNIRDTIHEESKLIIINKIEDWIEENKPSNFLTWWNNNYIYFPLLGIAIICLALLLFTTQNSTSQLYQNSLIPQIEDILEHGIDESNLSTALEFLLIKEFSYVPPSFQSKVNPTIYLLVIIVCILIAVVGACPPKANIAIGAGRRKVQFWKNYVKIITISIPTLIILPLLINFISSFM